MPQRYQGHRIPAVIYANTFDYVVGFICILSGLRIIFEPDAQPASIGDLPWVLSSAYRVLLIVAGVLILFGLSRRYTTDWGTAFERSGMWFAGTAFITYGAAAAVSPETKDSSFIAILTLLAVAAGCGVRAMGLGIESRAMLRTLRDAPRVNGGQE